MKRVGTPGPVAQPRRVERHRRDAPTQRAKARHRPSGVGEHAVLARTPQVPGIVRAAALLSAPTDFHPFTEARGRDALGRWPRPAETQPISFARTDAQPMLLMHGTADTVVRPHNSERLAAKLERLGAPAELLLYAGKNHVDLVKSLSPAFRGTTPALADSVTFLEANSR